MTPRLRLLLFVFAIPLLAALTASAARDRWEQRWSTGLQREFRVHGHRAGAAVMARYSLGALCGDARRAAGIPPCRTYNQLSRLIVAAAAASALGVLWIGVTTAIGLVASRRRSLGIASFQPVVYGSAVVLVILLAAQGLLAVQGLSAAGRLLLPGAALDSIGTGAGLLAALVIGLSGVQALRAVRGMNGVPYVFARVLPAGQAPGLHGVVGRLSAASRLPTAVEVLAGLAPTAFTAAGPIDSLDGRRAGPVLHVPLTLARILTVAECEALLAAQLARVRDRRSIAAGRFSLRWLRLHEEAGRLRSAGRLVRAATVPAAWWLASLLDAFEAAAAAAWRDEEAAGDRAAVAFAGGEAYGAALVKVHAFGGAWDAALRAMGEAAAAGEQYENSARLFAGIVSANADPARVAHALSGLAEAAAGGSGAVLPRAGGAGAVPVALAAIDVSPPVPATTLFGEAAERLEQDLTDLRHLQLRA